MPLRASTNAGCDPLPLPRFMPNTNYITVQ